MAATSPDAKIYTNTYKALGLLHVDIDQILPLPEKGTIYLPLLLNRLFAKYEYIKLKFDTYYAQKIKFSIG